MVRSTRFWSLGVAFTVLSAAGCEFTIAPPADDGASTRPAGSGGQAPSAGNPRGGAAPIGDGSVRNVTPIQDGSSNTILPGEPAPSGLSPDVLAAITTQLGDKFFEFASSSGNSDRNAFVTGTNQLELCAFGRFGRRETTIFSSSVGDFDSTTDSFGTWRIVDAGGAPALELRIESSNDRNSPSSVRLSIATNAAGALFLDGQQATVSDAAADCAAAQATTP